MSTSEMVGRDIYYRVNRANGTSYVEQARVWDADRFLEAQRAAGAKPENAEERYVISSATEAEYKAQAKAGRK